ncbi:MAG: hypothetical protein WCR69_09430 [Sulfuricurvum sp.]
MQSKDKIDKLYKIADITNKKLIVLLAIDGGIGAYSIKFIEQGDLFGYIFGLVFIIVSMAIAYNYNELNKIKRTMEEI